MPEKTIAIGSAEIYTESFGDAANPTLLLIMGASASMLWWPEDLCRLLAASGFHVIRFDQRDTGRSTVYPPGQPGYTVDDMVADVFAILDAYALPRAHLAGHVLGRHDCRVSCVE